ncbi:glucose 1-dehydrogenase [Hoeflea prorocentri]|uniref:Glucose 1-dehydrogenase n=1 Tax=Hoeflea prorocentri TaxID=1922333 RepID=A0A9X3UGF8_9HYPH|nr:glucose 1-dehydrogenase [Hoeflea prorocentri]MCY6380169.1 glucose 1-dehydrogenase [Hoeflea prorocentri]MDA5397969.1 glucose 1-dehydrogenase [Hoeflea prorocentri]
MRGLKGRNAIVTGGASGIGAAISRRLAEEGAHVAIFDLDRAGAENIAGTITKAGGAAKAYQVDITDRAAVFEAVAELTQNGSIDILVNNAGWDRLVPFVESDTDLWTKVIDINLYGPLHVHHAVLPIMIEQGRGRVINIASDAGRVGSTGEAVYSACKGGIIAFTKTMARELARSGIRLNAVCPGPTDTPLFAEFAGDGQGERIKAALEKAIPVGRLARPSDFPGIVCFLASDDAEFITGQTVSVSGGLTMS